ncbi:UNVERIFIED_CONTAM: protein PHOTOPERIOD-INDEPENDENT EARLY FLOWERING 1, partial [Sesamum radiatum]
ASWRNHGYPKVQGLNLAMNGQKAVKAPKETRRPKTHWDHVLEEMAWLSKDIESERKWKRAQANKVQMRANQATRGEKRVKAVKAPKEPQHPKTNWDHVLEEMAWLSMDIESERIWKLAQAKKVEIRANQATRGRREYSPTLGENFVNSPTLCKSSNLCTFQEQPTVYQKGGDNREKNIRVRYWRLRLRKNLGVLKRTGPCFERDGLVVKGREQKLRQLALNISKDVKVILDKGVKSLEMAL